MSFPSFRLRSPRLRSIAFLGCAIPPLGMSMQFRSASLLSMQYLCNSFLYISYPTPIYAKLSHSRAVSALPPLLQSSLSISSAVLYPGPLLLRKSLLIHALPLRFFSLPWNAIADLRFAYADLRTALLRQCQAVFCFALPSLLDSVPGRCSPFLLSSRPCRATAALVADALVIASPVQGASL